MSEDTAHTAAAPAGAGGSTLAPIDSDRRIGVLDVLRGFALIGILLMNIEWFGRYLNSLGTFDPTLTGLDHAVGWLIRCLVEGKFYKLFALLFGMGFAVMLMRAQETGRPFGAWFARRMLVLFAIGALHMVFLWGGDILHDYAFAGLLLLGFVLLLRTKRLQRFNNTRSMTKLALGWLAFPFVASAAAALVYSLLTTQDELATSWEDDVYVSATVEERVAAAEAAPNDDLSSAGDVVDAMDQGDLADEENPADTGATGETGGDEEDLSKAEVLELRIADIVSRRLDYLADERVELDAFTGGSYLEVTRYRIAFFADKLAITPFFSMFMLMPIFLLGYCLISSGVMREPHKHRTLFRSMAWLGTVFGLLLTIAGLVIVQHPVGEIAMVLRGTGETLFFLGQYVLCAGYIGIVVRCMERPRASRWLGALAPMGRMALTNYIMQSLILTTLFYGYGFGLFGQVSRAPQMLIVVAILAFQLVISTWWLKRFRFGPLEWLWRSLTYKSVQPIRL